MKGGGHVAQIYGESQELGTWVEGGSYPWVFLKLMYLFCVCVSFSQQSASPSPKPWWPITRNVSEGGSFPSGWGGGAGQGLALALLHLVTKSRRTLPGVSKSLPLL